MLALPALFVVDSIYFITVLHFKTSPSAGRYLVSVGLLLFQMLVFLFQML